MEQGGTLISSLFTLRRIAYSIKEDRNDMATWNSRGLRGSTLEDMINKTNEKSLRSMVSMVIVFKINAVSLSLEPLLP